MCMYKLILYLFEKDCINFSLFSNFISFNFFHKIKWRKNKFSDKNSMHLEEISICKIKNMIFRNVYLWYVYLIFVHIWLFLINCIRICYIDPFAICTRIISWPNGVCIWGKQYVTGSNPRGLTIVILF